MNNEHDVTITAQDIVNIAGSYQRCRALLTAVELDVFSHLGRENLSSEDLANRMNVDARGLDRLLNAICAMDLLRKENGLFSNTYASLQWLDRKSPEYLGNLLHMGNTYNRWATLTEAVKAGGTVSEPIWEKEHLVKPFIEAMDYRARKSAPVLAKEVDMSEADSMLDVGGGSGIFSVAFIRENPRLCAVVMDLPEVTPLTEKYVSDAGVSDRISIHNGDYHTDPFPRGFDLVFFSAIVHINSYEENEKLVQKAYQSLNPGGKILIQDFIMDESRTSPAFGALFALNMLVNTPYGDTYTEQEIREWMMSAGFSDISRIQTMGPSDMMTAIKSSAN